MAFSEAHCQGFSLGTLVSSPPASVNGFSQYSEAEINAISTLSDLIAELYLRTMWHTKLVHTKSARCVAHDLHMIVPWPLERMCERQFAVQ